MASGCRARCHTGKHRGPMQPHMASKARAYADRVLELHPENADACTTSSLGLMMKGRYDEATCQKSGPTGARLG